MVGEFLISASNPATELLVQGHQVPTQIFRSSFNVGLRESVLKEAVVAYFQIISQNLSEGIEEESLRHDSNFPSRDPIQLRIATQVAVELRVVKTELY